MIQSYVKDLGDTLACPSCLAALQGVTTGLVCMECSVVYPYVSSSQIDLRLQRPKLQTVVFQVGQDLREAQSLDYRPLEMASDSRVDFGGKPAPRRMSDEFRSHIPRASHPGALILDLGCGTLLHREVCEDAGFRYVGLDYKSDAAPILGDAHALPFQNGIFEVVLSMAVLEHLQYPFVAVQEVSRVLREDGIFMGSVAFLEPFHDNSFYHHSHLGVYNTLRSAGLSVIRIAPNTPWTAMRALYEMHTLPKKAKPLVQLINKLCVIRDRFRPRPERILASVGSFFFIATKDA